MGLYNPKIDQEQDTANNVKRKILKKEIFNKENCYFSKYGFLHFFAPSWSVFVLYRLILPLWNSQSEVTTHK